MKTTSILCCVFLLFLYFAAGSADAFIALSSEHQSLVADGVSRTTITVTIKESAVPLPGVTVYFETTAGYLLNRSAVTDVDGNAYATLIAGTYPGNALITASYMAKWQMRSQSMSVRFIEDTTPKGIYALVSRGKLDEGILSNPYLSGISIREFWSTLEPEEGAYYWNILDRKIAAASRAGKRVSIAVVPGVRTPNWVYKAGAEKLEFTDINPDHRNYGKRLEMPVPWDQIYLSKWNNFIQALADRYGNNPDIAWIRITGPMNSVSAEWNLPDRWRNDVDWTYYGYSHAKLIAAINSVTDTFASAFPLKHLSMAVRPTKIWDETGIKVASAVITHGFSSYPDQFVIQKNDLSPLIQPSISEHPDSQHWAVWNFVKQAAPRAGGQTLWSATNDPQNKMSVGLVLSGVRDVMLRTVDVAIQNRLSFLEMYEEDILNPELQDILMFLSESF